MAKPQNTPAKRASSARDRSSLSRAGPSAPSRRSRNWIRPTRSSARLNQSSRRLTRSLARSNGPSLTPVRSSARSTRSLSTSLQLTTPAQSPLPSPLPLSSSSSMSGSSSSSTLTSTSSSMFSSSSASSSSSPSNFPSTSSAGTSQNSLPSTSMMSRIIKNFVLPPTTGYYLRSRRGYMLDPSITLETLKQNNFGIVQCKIVLEDLFKRRPNERINLPSIIIPGKCMVCSVENANYACIPCGHKVVCVNCKGNLSVCPRCERGIYQVIQIYE